MPSGFRVKAEVELAIGTEEQPPGNRDMPLRERFARAPFRVLYAGRFVDYKGMHLGLPAFARLAQAMPDARLTMVGEGPLERRWRKLAQELGIAGNMQWLPWQDHRAMAGLYAEHDVLLFPSMHDSGGMVVLEAMSQGLPVVCLKLGGPATMVNDSCGCSIDPAGKSAAQVIQEMGCALIALAAEPARLPFAEGAKLRCRDFSWPEKVARIYGLAS
jgi:glycosyltransferase involved in cell wall biosynthesis